MSPGLTVAIFYQHPVFIDKFWQNLSASATIEH